MRSYRARLEALTPLLMHRDNLEFNALISRWQRDPANNGKSIPGDDRSPAWSWIGALYHDGMHIAVPTDAVMAACMGAGAEVRTGRGQKTFKAQTQSGMAFTEPFLRLQTGDREAILLAELIKLQENAEFDAHMLEARRLGFALDVRRVSVGKSKHVRVRPVFERWTATGTLSVWDEALTTDILGTIFHVAGDKYGLLDWRPAAPRRPGPFGRFRATLAAA